MICSGDRRTNGWAKEAAFIDPHHHLFGERESKEEEGGGGGLWQRRGKLKRIITIRRWRGCGKGPHLFRSNQVIILHLLIELWSAKTSKTEEKWRGMTKQLNMALIFSAWIPCISMKLSLPDFSMHSLHMRQMKFPPLFFFFIETRLFHASFPYTFMATILLSLTRLPCFEETNKIKLLSLLMFCQEESISIIFQRQKSFK